jgi:hypothetical protein
LVLILFLILFIALIPVLAILALIVSRWFIRALFLSMGEIGLNSLPYRRCLSLPSGD